MVVICSTDMYFIYFQINLQTGSPVPESNPALSVSLEVNLYPAIIILS